MYNTNKHDIEKMMMEIIKYTFKWAMGEGVGKGGT